MGERLGNQDKNEFFSSPASEEIQNTYETDQEKSEIEKTPEEDLEKARKEVAEEFESEKSKIESRSSKESLENEERSVLLTPKDKNRVYEDTLYKTQQQLNGPSRAFSKVIHNRAIEASSEFISKTIARPTSILYGSILAFVVMSLVYLLAKKNGFELSGSELIILFVAGWIIGLLVDFIRRMLSYKL